MNKKLIKRIEDLFNKKLAGKSSYGRQEIKALLRDSINEALLEFIDKEKRKE